MNRETLAAVGLALLAVVALGVAGATLDTAVSTGGDGGFAGDGDALLGDEESDHESVGSSPPPADFEEGSPVCLEELREPPALLALFGFFVLVGALAYRESESLIATTVVVGTTLIPVGGLWLILSTCGPLTFPTQEEEPDPDDESLLSEMGGGGAPGTGEGEAVSTPEALFMIVVVLALLVSVLLLVAARGDDEAGGGVGSGADEEHDDEKDPDLTAVGRTAGAAADRIEDATADNEVYRAWREMTEVLDVDRPDSSTPREFATAATAAGVDPDAVDDLTDVFEAVRYGGADPTGDREAAAVDALRRIEAAHDGGED